MERSMIKPYIAARVAQEFRNGDVVNLGIGLPTLIPNYLPQGVQIVLQSENGIVGMGKNPEDPIRVTDAGGMPASAASGGSYIDSAVSFGLIRGGHVDCTVLGALEVDARGSLANWIIPGKKCQEWAEPWTWWSGQKGYRSHGAYGQGQTQNTDGLHPSLYRSKLRKPDCHGNVCIPGNG